MRDEVNKELKRLMDLAIDKENYEYIQDIGKALTMINDFYDVFEPRSKNAA